VTKARKRVSLNNRAVARKTNLFSLKQPSKGNDEKSATLSSQRKKGTEPIQRRLKKVGFLVCAEEIKYKTCGLVY
jgi:hypothetical protein